MATKEETDRAISAMIDMVMGDLIGYLNHWFPDDDFDQYVNYVRKFIADGNTAEDLHKLDREKFPPKGCNLEYIPFYVSIAYCIEAYAAYKAGEYEKGNDLTYSADAYADDVLHHQLSSKERQNYARSSGGHAKATKNYRLAEKEAIRLIKHYMPENGWSKPSDVYTHKTLTDNLGEFCINNNIPMGWGNIDSILKRWLSGKPSVREAYEACHSSQIDKTRRT